MHKQKHLDVFKVPVIHRSCIFEPEGKVYEEMDAAPVVLAIVIDDELRIC